MEEDVTTSYPPRIVFYDGVCGLCNKVVQLLVKLDKEKRFRYAALQGEAAANLRLLHPELPQNLESMAYIEDGQVYVKAKAIMFAAGQLKFPFNMPYFFRWIPSFLANPGYNLIAALRYKIWGKYDSCRLPTPEERQLFLA